MGAERVLAVHLKGQWSKNGAPRHLFDVIGPVMMRGDLTLAGPDGPIKETRAAVCGCGKTSNAPFCDGTCGCSP